MKTKLLLYLIVILLLTTCKKDGAIVFFEIASVCSDECSYVLEINGQVVDRYKSVGPEMRMATARRFFEVEPDSIKIAVKFNDQYKERTFYLKNDSVYIRIFYGPNRGLLIEESRKESYEWEELLVI